MYALYVVNIIRFLMTNPACILFDSSNILILFSIDDDVDIAIKMDLVIFLFFSFQDTMIKNILNCITPNENLPGKYWRQLFYDVVGVYWNRVKVKVRI